MAAITAVREYVFGHIAHCTLVVMTTVNKRVQSAVVGLTGHHKQLKRMFFVFFILMLLCNFCHLSKFHSFSQYLHKSVFVPNSLSKLPLM